MEPHKELLGSPRIEFQDGLCHAWLPFSCCDGGKSAWHKVFIPRALAGIGDKLRKLRQGVLIVPDKIVGNENLSTGATTFDPCWKLKVVKACPQRIDL